MTAYLRSPLTVIWLLLVAVTFLSWWIGVGGDRGASGTSFSITTAVVAIALLKARFVFSHFMEVRTGPAWLGATCDGWLAAIAFILVALYACRLHAEHFR